MEVKKVNLEKLKLFKNRQVVINTYEDEELISKEGFFYDNVEVKTDKVEFIKNNNISYTIHFQKYPYFKEMDGFKNYFSFSNFNNDKVEIYFP